MESTVHTLFNSSANFSESTLQSTATLWTKNEGALQNFLNQCFKVQCPYGQNMMVGTSGGPEIVQFQPNVFKAIFLGLESKTSNNLKTSVLIIYGL